MQTSFIALVQARNGGFCVWNSTTISFLLYGGLTT